MKRNTYVPVVRGWPTIIGPGTQHHVPVGPVDVPVSCKFKLSEWGVKAYIVVPVGNKSSQTCPSESCWTFARIRTYVQTTCSVT